jgi:hypothetical protein
LWGFAISFHNMVPRIVTGLPVSSSISYLFCYDTVNFRSLSSKLGYLGLRRHTIQRYSLLSHIWARCYLWSKIPSWTVRTELPSSCINLADWYHLTVHLFLRYFGK